VPPGVLCSGQEVTMTGESTAGALDIAQVRHVAGLARLALDDAELEALTPQLAGILRYAEQVGEVAADDVEPMTHPLGLADVYRDDVGTPGLTRDDVLAAAPEPVQGRFGVPRIVEEDA
jgi:aspartyl-tRNA(Asn)/glutamyl-tRNA(Gln) amidotransferase subunit C